MAQNNHSPSVPCIRVRLVHPLQQSKAQCIAYLGRKIWKFITRTLWVPWNMSRDANLSYLRHLRFQALMITVQWGKICITLKESKRNSSIRQVILILRATKTFESSSRKRKTQTCLSLSNLSPLTLIVSKQIGMPSNRKSNSLLTRLQMKFWLLRKGRRKSRHTVQMWAQSTVHKSGMATATTQTKAMRCSSTLLSVKISELFA